MSDPMTAADDEVYFGMCCPNCYEPGRLQVTFTGTCEILAYDGTDDCGGHEWDDESAAGCTQCDYAGTVEDFTHANWRYEVILEDETVGRFVTRKDANAFIAEQPGPASDYSVEG